MKTTTMSRQKPKHRLSIPDGTWVSIDPGTRYTGVAIWDGENLRQTILWRVSSSLYPQWLDRVSILSTYFQNQLWNAGLIVCESPVNYMSTSRGAASVLRGDTIKVAMLVGALVGIVSRYGTPIKLIEPTRWKGQMPKHIMQQRVRSITKKKFIKDEYDAVGLGLWCLGRFP